MTGGTAQGAVPLINRIDARIAEELKLRLVFALGPEGGNPGGQFRRRPEPVEANSRAGGEELNALAESACVE